MELSVKTLDSKTHIFKDLDHEMSVSQFKSHISPTVALVPAEQRLIFRGRVLQDDKKLKDYNVSSGQVVHLVARNPNSGSGNDQPQIQRPNTAGPGALGHHNTVIMGHIGTLEFPTNSMTGPPHRPNSPSSLRLAVANQSLRVASDLLRSLEEDITILNSPPPPSQEPETGSQNDASASMAPIRDASGAAVLAALRSFQTPTYSQSSQEQGSSSTENVASAERQNNPQIQTGLGAAASTPSNNTGNSAPAQQEAPMLRELGETLNDLISFNTRLMPYLQTLQRWLHNNQSFGEEVTSAQYTFDTISSILHSLSHSIHSISDLTVDFSREPNQRRVRAPTLVRIEQSPIIRATIPIGVHVGMDADPNRQNNAQTQQPPPQPQVIGAHVLGGGQVQGAAQFQQAISNIIQGIVTGQQTPMTSSPNINISPGQFFSSDSSAFTSVPNANVQPGNPEQNLPENRSVLGNQSGTGARGHHFVSINQNSPTTNSNPQPQQQSVQDHINSIMNRIRGGEGGQRGIHHVNNETRRLEMMTLPCQSHHYHSVRRARPENLYNFLSQEIRTEPETHTQVFETFVSILQGVNTLHPVLASYIRWYILRGRDANNQEHVKTGVRVYARKLVQWIVDSISASYPDFDSADLNTRLSTALTEMFAKITEVVLNETPGIHVTPKITTILNECMPGVLGILETSFPAPAHLRIFKGIILLLVNACFPSASVVFTTQLTTGIAEYLINCRPTPPPEYRMHHISTEVSMEIDVEIGEMIDTSGSGDDLHDHGHSHHQSQQQQPSAPFPASLSINNTNFLDSNELPPVDEEEESSDMEAEFMNMTQNLFSDLPQPWHVTLLHDIQRQGPLREYGAGGTPYFSAGFLSLFPANRY